MTSKKEKKPSRKRSPVDESDDATLQAPQQDAQGPERSPPSDADGATAAEEAAEVDPLTAIGIERDDLLSRLQRLGADYRHYQTRAQRDLAQARQFANEDLIKSLLPVLDDMERALIAARENHEEDDPLLQGMQIVHDKALETLERFGLQPIEAEGTEFDPDRHTAMMQQPSADHPPNAVLQAVQKGYALRGRTIRPAGVIVSAAPVAAKDDGDASSDTEEPNEPGNSPGESV